MFKRTKGISTTDVAAKLLMINNDSVSDSSDDSSEEEKQEGAKRKPKVLLPKILGCFNANPNFLASAKRIANFSSTREPSECDKVVYLDGSFDLLHPGHIEQLRKARELGDYLIVGIHDDQCVNQYLGEHYPINSLNERVLNVLACKYVDDVIIGAPFKVTNKLIRDINAGIVVKSLEYIQHTLREEARLLNPYEVAEHLEI